MNKLRGENLAKEQSLYAYRKSEAMNGKYIKDCLDTNWVSSVGMYVDKFQADMAKRAEAKYAIAGR